MYHTSNTLSENIRTKSAELLNQHLAAAIDLHAQVKQAHWNVRGPAFIAIHELFDKVADAVEGYSDTIAERAAALGGTAEGTIHVAVERSFLEQYKLGVADERAHITAVTAALAGFGCSARKAIDEAAAFGDQDTSDVFTEISRGIDYQLWLVESHLKPQSHARDQWRSTPASRRSSEAASQRRLHGRGSALIGSRCVRLSCVSGSFRWVGG